MIFRTEASGDLMVGRAWVLKAALRRRRHYIYPESDRNRMKRRQSLSTHSRLKSIRIVTYHHHPVTTARNEGLNNHNQKF